MVDGNGTVRVISAGYQMRGRSLILCMLKNKLRTSRQEEESS